ncbi:MAG: bis(5'-nucleosyl)-tetraphosphatase (symmetrical) YqeK [Clostridia bacterium]|nr:bis(5'-nucleosyl)-tetraphosphatase (symmetrical) YqeK [Clostridia bacterium]
MREDAFYLSEIEKRLTYDRFVHSLNVADCAKELALRYGADPAKAYTAGLVHDIMKDAPKDLQREYVIKSTGGTDPVLMSQKALWHAVAGAYVLEHELGCDDEEILRAVRYHTSGRAGMSLLEKIVFTADFISADRKYPGVEEMRVFASRSLAEAMEEGLNFTIKELCAKRRPIYRDTVDAYNEAVFAKKEGE